MSEEKPNPDCPRCGGTGATFSIHGADRHVSWHRCALCFPPAPPR